MPEDNTLNIDPNQTSTQPDNVADEHWDAEKGVVKHDAVVESYAQLRKLVSEKGADGAAAELNQQDQQTQGDKQDNEQKPTDGEIPSLVQSIVDRAGLKVEGLRDKYLAQGNLDDADYHALEQVGCPRKDADDFFKGQVAVNQLQNNQNAAILTEADTLVGGEQNRQTLLAWAHDNIPEQEQKLINDQLASATWRGALFDLMVRYEQATGAPLPSARRSRIDAGGQAATSATSFQTQAEVNAAMADPRYNDRSPKYDPAFRKQTDQRLLKSPNPSLLPAR